MDKNALIELLVNEQHRVERRIKRHEDVMPDILLEGLEQRREALVFALSQVKKLAA